MITPQDAEKLTEKECDNIEKLEHLIDEQLQKLWIGTGIVHIDLDVYYNGKPTVREVAATIRMYEKHDWKVKYFEESNRFEFTTGENK